MRPLFCLPRTPLDGGTKLITGIVVVICAWILCLPFWDVPQRALLERYHLRSPHYLVWAIQQPIPAMYSCENRYWWIEAKGEFLPVPELESAKESRLVNHFPVRLLTFGDNRVRLLRDGQPVTLAVRSRYQGSELSTACHAIPNADGSYRLMRVDISGLGDHADRPGGSAKGSDCSDAGTTGEMGSGT